MISLDRSRVRLEYLDGIRGLAALYVVLSHVYGAVRFWSHGAGLPNVLQKGLMAFHFGHYMVDIFIVLSGYVLMLPALKHEGHLVGGTGSYLARRARRILPPYYAAVGASFLVYFATLGAPVFRDGVAWTPTQLWTHLTLTNNLREAWTLPFNAPLWSVASEWQIYFVFPVLLLPMWRRFGAVSAVGAGFAAGLMLHFGSGGWLVRAHPWYLGLFALGMLAATVGFGTAPRWERWRTRVRWDVVALVVGVVLGALSLRDNVALREQRWVADTIAGIAAAALLVDCTQRVRGALPGNALTRVFASRPAVVLGGFSYSLYLMHYPLLTGLYPYVVALDLPPVVFLAVLLLGVVPTIVGVCWLFSRAFERPFLSPSSQGRSVGDTLQGGTS